MEEQQTKQHIDTDFLVKTISEGGEFSKAIPDFEHRTTQIDLLKSICEVFNADHHLIAEAGTGVGKSLAYLLPSIYYKKDEKILISTNTKALQDQLFEKDIPSILETLQVPLKVGLAKGKNNFLCIKKTKDYLDHLEDFANEEIEYLPYMEPTKEGIEIEYPDMPVGLWRKVCATDVCTRKKCAYFEGCYYFKNKKDVAASDIIICNHHLLTCDLSLRSQSENYKNSIVLPVCTKLIIDEAHNFEDIFIKNFTKTFSRKGILHVLAMAYSIKSKKGLLPKLKKNASKISLNIDEITFEELIQNLIGLITINSDDTLEYVYRYIKSFDSKNPEVRYRLKKVVASSPRWFSAVGKYLESLANELIKIGTKFEIILTHVEGAKDNHDDSTELLLVESKKLKDSILGMGALAERYNGFDRDKDVRWIETFKENVSFNISPLDIATILRDGLYPNFSSVVYTSATLTFDRKFTHINRRLGLHYLPEEKFKEKLLDSPFDYEKNALILTPMVKNDPNSRDFVPEVAEYMKDICLHLEGRTFILFTSFYMLNDCYRKIQADLRSAGITPLSQAVDNKSTLVERFKKTDKAVLFGTSTFWEGIDIKGDKLQCIIIPRVPFQVPTEPIVEAKMEVIEEQGGNSFMDFMLPAASIKLKQGFGRLIRSKVDTGTVWFLDSRINKKSYGRKFINSLPPAPRITNTFATCFEKFKEFTNVR